MTRLNLPAIGLGCASLGRPETSDEEVHATLLAALDRGIGYLDMAPLYGCGLAERRVGRALAARPGSRPKLSTKVGYVIEVPEGTYLPPSARRTDYSRAGVRDSLARSLERVGVARFDLAFIHGPDGVPDEAERAFEALDELRQEGLVGAIGVGTNFVETALAVMERCSIDAVLIAGRLTLLDRQAEVELLAACARRQVALIAGGVFNSGILAALDPAASKFDYAPAPARLAAATRDLATACKRHGVPLKAAALQFVSRHAGVTTTLLGAANRVELADCLEGLDATIPEVLWAELDAVVEAHAL